MVRDASTRAPTCREAAGTSRSKTGPPARSATRRRASRPRGASAGRARPRHGCELDDRRPGLDRLARQHEAELAGHDLHARGRRRRRRSGDQRRPLKADDARDDARRVDAEPLLEQRGVDARGSRRSRAGCRPRRARSQARELADHRPCARVPIRNADAGGAVVGAVRAVLLRRGGRTPSRRATSTRSARPRASRSRWKASSESAVSLRPCASAPAWSECVS